MIRRASIRIAALLALLCCAAVAHAHDVGVTRVEIVEESDERYVLTAEAPQAVAPMFGPPRFPAGFERADDQQGAPTSAGGLRFEFVRAGRPLRAGEIITVTWPRDGLLVQMRWSDGTTVTRLFQPSAGITRIELGELAAGSGSLIVTGMRYTRLGIEHILSGVDHLVFVFGLLMIVSGPWVLVKTITAFTIAHSITLGAATLSLVTPPEPTVNVLIALSILFLGPEMARALSGRSSLTIRRPWLVAFGFGLLHGFGFASGLSALGMPTDEIPMTLLSFNIGVEIGQLGFVLALLILAVSTRVLEFRWSTWQIRIPVYMVGTLGAYWTLSRLIQLFGGSV